MSKKRNQINYTIHTSNYYSTQRAFPELRVYTFLCGSVTKSHASNKEMQAYVLSSIYSNR